MSDGKIQRIPLGQLIPHPDNPRVELDEDRIERFAESMAEAGFIADQYAFTVRPFEAGYQVIQGHHRREAGLKAGIKEAPCIVVDMTDEEAFFELVKGNDQSDIAPIELGFHVLKYVEHSEVGAGRGNSGGIRAYAKSVGRNEKSVRLARDAAEVLSTLDREENAETFRILRGKPNHLAVVHRAPIRYWSALMGQIVSRSLTISQVDQEVKAILDAENAKLEAAEREAKEEADAKAFIEAKSPDLAKQVESGVFQSFAEAQAVWEKRNREEAARIAKEKEAAELREREERRGRTQKYSNILSSIHNLASWGDYNDTPWVMEDFNPAELSPTDLYKVVDEAESAARFIKEFIEWRDAR